MTLDQPLPGYSPQGVLERRINRGLQAVGAHLGAYGNDATA